MVSYILTAGIALLSSMASAAALPAPAPTSLSVRQATLPDQCTDYCSVSAGCVCIRRPTNCTSPKSIRSDISILTTIRRRDLSRRLGRNLRNSCGPFQQLYSNGLVPVEPVSILWANAPLLDKANGFVVKSARNVSVFAHTSQSALV